MYFLYILQCADSTFYTGITTDLKRRVAEHNGQGNSGAKYTSGRRPVSLVYVKKFENRSLALREEARVKKLRRESKLELFETRCYAGGLWAEENLKGRL